MSFNVLLTRDAAGDLEELYDHIPEHDAPSKGDYGC
jgi:plasmid stabilization system protein ParE